MSPKKGVTVAPYTTIASKTEPFASEPTILFIHSFFFFVRGKKKELKEKRQSTDLTNHYIKTIYVNGNEVIILFHCS